MPSTSTSGVVLLPKVEMPRIQKVELAPGSPERCTEITPASWLARLLEILAVGIRMSLTETEAIDPTTLAFFCVPYPTTTTSSSSLPAESSITLGRLVTGNSCVW